MAPSRPTEPLVQLLYTSQAVKPFTELELIDLMARARVKNTVSRLSGMLLYADGAFFQVLEGPDDKVEALYSRIQVDPRHHRLTRLAKESIDHRSFGDWSMGLVSMDSGELARMPGLRDIPTTRDILSQLAPGQARRLMQTFAEDRWRSRIAA